MEYCRIHPNKEAPYQCRQCGQWHCVSCTRLVEGEPYCEICWDHYIIHEPAGGKQKSDGREFVPWHYWRQLGFLRAFWLTARDLAMRPRPFFGRIHEQTQLGGAIVFALICILLIWYPIRVMYLTLVIPTFLAQIEPMQESTPALTEFFQESQARLANIGAADLLFMPVVFVFYYLIVSSVLPQGLVRLFRGKRDYSATFQIRCYAMVTHVLALVPLLGFLLAEVASLLVCALGFRVVQQIRLPEALLVASVPMLLMAWLAPLIM